jgi:hypothetical protein
MFRNTQHGQHSMTNCCQQVFLETMKPKFRPLMAVNVAALHSAGLPCSGSCSSLNMPELNPYDRGMAGITAISLPSVPLELAIFVPLTHCGKDCALPGRVTLLSCRVAACCLLRTICLKEPLKPGRNNCRLTPARCLTITRLLSCKTLRMPLHLRCDWLPLRLHV